MSDVKAGRGKINSRAPMRHGTQWISCCFSSAHVSLTCQFLSSNGAAAQLNKNRECEAERLIRFWLVYPISRKMDYLVKRMSKMLVAARHRQMKWKSVTFGKRKHLELLNIKCRQQTVVERSILIKPGPRADDRNWTISRLFVELRAEKLMSL